MKSEINLISQNQLEIAKSDKSLRILRFIAIASVCVIGISSLILFFIIQSISPAGIRKQQDALRVSLASSRVKEAKAVLISRKLKDIKQIIKGRENYDVLLADINSAIPENISINELEVNEEVVRITATSNSLLPIDRFLNNLLAMVEKKKFIGNLSISGLTSEGEGGEYSVSITGKRI